MCKGKARIFKDLQKLAVCFFTKRQKSLSCLIAKETKISRANWHHEEEVKHYEVKMIKFEQEIDRLKATIQDIIDIGHEDSLNTDKLGKLYELGTIDKEGNKINRDMIEFL